MAQGPGRSGKAFGINDVLVDHTLLARAGLVMEEAERLDWEYLVDLFALIEAVALHDRLLTLPARLSRCERDLPLRRVLQREGILCDYTPRSRREDVAVCATQLATFDKGASPLELAELRDTFDSAVSGIYGEEPEERMVISRSIARLLRPSTSVMPSRAYAFAREGYGVPFYLMRTYIYSAVCQLESLSQYPDVERIPILISLEYRLTRLLTDRAYARLAKCLDLTVKELSHWGGPFSESVPPAAALALAKCSRSEDLYDAVLEVRREFREFRQTFATYQRGMARASTVAEREKLAREIRWVVETLAETYGGSERRFVYEVLDWLRAIAGSVRKPLDRDSFSNELLKRPQEWLRRWWLRRSRVHVFDLMSKIKSIPHYGSLIENVFGRPLLPVEKARLEQYARALHSEIADREEHIRVQ